MSSKLSSDHSQVPTPSASIVEGRYFPLIPTQDLEPPSKEAWCARKLAAVVLDTADGFQILSKVTAHATKEGLSALRLRERSGDDEATEPPKTLEFNRLPRTVYLEEMLRKKWPGILAVTEDLLEVTRSLQGSGPPTTKYEDAVPDDADTIAQRSRQETLVRELYDQSIDTGCLMDHPQSLWRLPFNQGKNDLSIEAYCQAILKHPSYVIGKTIKADAKYLFRKAFSVAATEETEVLRRSFPCESIGQEQGDQREGRIGKDSDGSGSGVSSIENCQLVISQDRVEFRH